MSGDTARHKEVYPLPQKYLKGRGGEFIILSFIAHKKSPSGLFLNFYYRRVRTVVGDYERRHFRRYDADVM